MSTRPTEMLPAPANRLGECPLWCERTQRLWWVDVLAPALLSYDPARGTCASHPIAARRLGSIALRDSGGLILACGDGIYAYDPETGAQRFLVDPEPGMAVHRKNDGRADPCGNFWVGTLVEETYNPVGRLYRVAPDLVVTTEAEGLAIPNALAFDADRGRMYFADTRAYAIQLFDFDLRTGRIGNGRIFARTEAPARPDGSCIDAEGCLWNALYAGGAVIRYAPSGEIVAKIPVPVTYPTCCCFGGRDLDRLFVTSALEPLSPEDRANEPGAGRVHVLDTGVRGRPEFRVGF